MLRHWIQPGSCRCLHKALSPSSPAARSSFFSSSSFVASLSIPSSLSFASCFSTSSSSSSLLASPSPSPSPPLSSSSSSSSSSSFSTFSALTDNHDESGLKQLTDYRNRHVAGGNPPIHRVCLTGGPCGGKSSAFSAISQRFSALGFRVFGVPEAATTLINGGVDWASMNENQVFVAQKNIVKTMIHMEDVFYDIAASTGQPSIIVCDRGTMDASAYMSEELWESLLDEMDWTLGRLRDKRYDLVLHMVTAADGAEEFYTLENNAARTETVDHAIELDKKIQRAWLGFSGFKIVDNRSNFKHKLDRVVWNICKIAGIQAPLSGKRYFLVERNEDVEFDHDFFNLQYTYLNKDDHDATGLDGDRVEMRIQNGLRCYQLRTKKQVGSKRIQLRRSISAREYNALMYQADASKEKIARRRSVFFWDDQYFEFDQIESPTSAAGLQILAVEVNDDEYDERLRIPSFFKVIKEVTDDQKYYSSGLETL